MKADSSPKTPTNPVCSQIVELQTNFVIVFTCLPVTLNIIIIILVVWGSLKYCCSYVAQLLIIEKGI